MIACFEERGFIEKPAAQLVIPVSTHIGNLNRNERSLGHCCGERAFDA